MAQPLLDLLTVTIKNLAIQSGKGETLECKHFFSGAALYVNGKICGSLTPAGFALKLPSKTQEHLLSMGAGKELRYFASAPVKKGYVVLSSGLLEDKEQLIYLITQSIEYALAKT